MRKRYIAKKLTAAFMVSFVAITGGCAGSGSTKDLMAGIQAVAKKEDVELDGEFVDKTADSMMKLFITAVDGTKNQMVSPVSVLTAMSMTANGAKGNTLEEMKGLSLDKEEVYSWLNEIEKREGKVFSCANSIWIRNDEDSFQVNNDFLEQNAKTLDAEIYSSDFKKDTVDAINQWVDSNTNGMITKIIDKIDPVTMMHLINAVAFEDTWQEPYEKEQVNEDVFTSVDGTRKQAEYLCSMEEKYIKDTQAVGVIKPYKHGFSFVAILPDQGVSLKDYMNKMSGSKFIDLIQNAEDIPVDTMIPKFKGECELEMRDCLKKMGIKDAFTEDAADFSGIGKVKDGNLFISSVFHKTYIEVDEQGTKASAVTDITLDSRSAEPMEITQVQLTRPFMYAIIDDATNHPVFIGTVTNL